MSKRLASNEIQDERSCVAITFRGHTKFCLTASWRRKDQELFAGQLGGRPHDQPFSLLHSYCLPLLQRLAPNTTVRGITLENFVRSPTYHIEISPSLDPNERARVSGTDSCAQEPSYHLLPTPTVDSPRLRKTIPQILASQLRLSPCRDDLDDLGSLSGKVRITSGEVFHFKSREEGREKEFDRELEILCRLKDLSLDKDRFRVSELRGIVVSGEYNEKTIGLVVALIPPHASGLHPLEHGFCGRFELHQKWEMQVSATVRELHRHDIVWGDVNPCNIVIYPDRNAWVIDFGGNYNWEFVDKGNAETEEGDWQGIGRLFREWLPSRRLWPSGEVGSASSTAELV